MNFKPASSLTTQIADHLCDEIVCGHIAPAERIQELKVARSLGVSRGSVREALLILEARHLIEILPRRGAVVRDLSERHVQELFEVASDLLTLMFSKAVASAHDSQLDALAALFVGIEQAAEQGNAQAFHDELLEFYRQTCALCGNHYLESVLGGLMPSMRRILFQLAANVPQRLSELSEAHHAILRAVQSRCTESVDRAVSDCLSIQFKLAQQSLVH